MEKDYGGEGLMPGSSPARLMNVEAFSAPPPPRMPGNMGHSGGPTGVLNVDSSILGMDHMAMAMLKRHQEEQQLLRNRMLLQQRQQDDALLAAALTSTASVSMLGRAPYLLGHPGLDPRLQVLLQQRQQMENGQLPSTNAGLDSKPPRPNLDLNRPNQGGARPGGDTKKRSTRAPYFDTSQVPDPPSDPKEEEEEEEDPSVAGEIVVDDDKDDKKKRKGGVGEPFPHKLYRMLEETEKNGQQAILSFFPHGRAFAIHKPGQFIEEVVPKYFSTNRMSSFQRQLNLYGFRRVTEGRDKGAYFHEYFLKGQKGLVKKIKRKKSMGPKPTKEGRREGAAQARQQVMFGAGFGLGIPASHLKMQNTSQQQDLLSQSLMMNGGGQWPSGLGSGLSGLPPSAMNGLLDPRMSYGSLGGNGGTRSHLLSVENGMSGFSSDATTAAFLREQQQSELLLAQLQQQQQQQQMAAHGGFLWRNLPPM